MTADEIPIWPHYSEEEIAAVSDILRSGRVNYWTGSEVREFEREYAAHTNSNYAVALANGTVSLELALIALGVGSGDEVITTPRTFIASASCIVVRGAKPVFADVDRESQNITARSIDAVLTPRTKAIIVVHLAGWPCEMDEIMSLARERKVAVIEDCAQAHGASYRGRNVGGIGTFGSFSFCQDKIISTGGEGGMLVMNDRDAWLRCWAYKDHGKSYEAMYERTHPVGFRWVHESFGTNWRLTEMQAAIGRLQLRRLPESLRVRRRNAEILTDGLEGISGLRVPRPPEHVEHAYYKFYAFLEPKALRSSWTRERVIREIVGQGIPCYSGSCSEVYLEKAFIQRGLVQERLPIAKELGESSLMFLVHPGMTAQNMERTAEVVRNVMSQAVR